MLPEPTDKHEEKALSDIRNYGLHIINVLEEGQLPNFAYSVGLWHTYRHPEILIIGLKAELSKWILNEIGSRLKTNNEKFELGRRYGGLLEGFDCVFFDVPQYHYKEYVGWDIWLYRGLDFPLLQCVYPTTDGIFPWQQSASDDFRAWQPILGANPDIKSK